jgi:hypothetical protein
VERPLRRKIVPAAIALSRKTYACHISTLASPATICDCSP